VRQTEDEVCIVVVAVILLCTYQKILPNQDVLKVPEDEEGDRSAGRSIVVRSGWIARVSVPKQLQLHPEPTVQPWTTTKVSKKKKASHTGGANIGGGNNKSDSS